MALSLTSTAFENKGLIPQNYTCDGSNISPSLQWKEVPSNTQSFVLIMDDPDAPGGVWDHWILFNIPSNTKELKENLKNLPSGALEGKNSWGKLEYGGPCPPPGPEHRYFFKLYALDSILTLSKGANKEELENVMNGHILEKAELMGRYQRK